MPAAVRRTGSTRLTGIGRLAGRAGQALVDQVLSSGAQLLLIVLVARQADAVTFGAVSVALIAHGFLLGVVRAAIGEVVLLRCRADRSAARGEACRGLFLALVAGVAASVGLLGAAAVVDGEVGHFVALIALAAPLVYTQDLLRYVAYGTGRVEQAIFVDGVWLGAQVVVSAVLLAAGEATPTRLVLVWMLGAGVGAAALGVRRRLWPRPVAVGRWWAAERARASGFLADFLVSNGMWQGAFLLLSALVPLAELAALRVALLSVSPLANLLAGVRSLILAHLADLRTQPARALRRAAQLGLGLAGAAAAYGIALVMLPDPWGAQLFGETWSEALPIVGIVAAAEIVKLPTFAAIDLIKVIGAPLDLVRTRLTSGVLVAGGLLLGGVVAGPRGAAIATGMGYALSQAIWWRQGRALSRRAMIEVTPVPA
jgi:hypothetical protein